MRIFMEVTTDEYQLPGAVADSPAELGAMVGSSSENIRTSAYHSRKGKRRKYISVDVEDDQEREGDYERDLQKLRELQAVL